MEKVSRVLQETLGVSAARTGRKLYATAAQMPLPRRRALSRDPPSEENTPRECATSDDTRDRVPGTGFRPGAGPRGRPPPAPPESDPTTPFRMSVPDLLGEQSANKH